MKTVLAAVAGLLTSALPAAPIPAAISQSRWSGEVADAALTPGSPLDPLPAVQGRARRIILPAPQGPVPNAAIIPFGEGGGTVTLLAARPDGWLAGTDAGEWGGSLYITRASQRVVLARGNVRGGFTWRGHLYVLSGVQHLSIDHGELWEVDLPAERLVRRIPLPAMPEDALLTPDQRLIVRTAKGDVALLPNGSVARSGNF